MFKDGEWKRWLRNMNSRLIALNINSTHKITKEFTPKEFLICHTLLIGSSDCSERGKMLLQSLSDHGNQIMPIIFIIFYMKLIPQFQVPN
jgi:hypothetical protein